ncbi:MAG: PrgI family protein [bacterium]|nr:PrgI family protein [bacterium]
MGMQFVVPQFIEVESKVIGPISVRQFIILLATFGIIYIEFELFSLVMFGIIGVITFGIGGVFAFVKVNSQPFHLFALTVIQTAKRPKLSMWYHEINMRAVTKKGKKDKDDKEDKDFIPKPEVSDSHLAELSLIADTAGQYSPADLEKLKQEQMSKQPVIGGMSDNNQQQ